MTEAPSNSEPQQRPKSKPAALVARVALFAVLGLLLIAAGYDFVFARNQSAEAFRQLEQRDKELSDAGTPFTESEVHKLLPFEPQVDNPNHLTKVETFRWVSVVPGREYSLWVIYRMNMDDQWQVDSYGSGGKPELASWEQDAGVEAGGANEERAREGSAPVEQP